MTAFNEIRAALESSISSVSGVPASKSWENVNFNPTTGTEWIRTTLIPGISRPAVAGPNPQLLYQGLLRIDIFYPEGDGPAEADTLADNIRDTFSPGDNFTSGSTNVRIRWSERGQGRLDGAWYTVPVTVSWYTYRQ